MAALPFLQLDLGTNLLNCKDFRNSQAIPSFSIHLRVDRIPQKVGITGITPIRAFISKTETVAGQGELRAQTRRSLEF